MTKSSDSSLYKTLFDYSPIPLWRMNYTKLFNHFDYLRKKGINNLENHFSTHPDEIIECIALVKISEVNKAVLDLFEIDNQQELINDLSNFVSENYYDVYSKKIAKLFRGENNFSINTEIISKNGIQKSVLLKTNIVDENNQNIGIVSTEDISELKKQEDQFKAAVDTSPDSITINKASDGKFVYTNKTFKNATGFSEEDTRDKSAFELGVWINLKDRETYFKALSEKGYIQDMATTFKAKNGAIRDVLLSAKTISYNNEPHFVVSTKDVTELNTLTLNLRQSEEQFRKAFMNIPDSVHINKVSDATFVDFNENFLKYTGYTREELLGKTPQDLNIWVDGVSNRSFYKPLKKDGRISNLEIVFRMKNGSLLQALISADIIELNGEPHIITVTKDITSFKEAQKELKRSEEQFRLSFITNPDPVHLIDIKTDTFVDINQRFLEFTGYTKEEVLGKNPEELNLWGDINDKYKVGSILKEKGFVENFQTHFRMKNGKILDGLFSVRVINIDNKPHFLSVIKDYTEIKKTQDALKKSEEKFQNIFSKSPDALAIMEMVNWTFVDVNKMFAKTTGLSYEEIIGKSTFDLNLWTRESDRTFITAKAQNKEEFNNYESLFTLKSGEQIHMLFSAKLIEINKEKFYFLIAKNINDFVKIQQDLFDKDNKYKAIVSNSYEGIAIIDNAFHFDYINQQMEVITGYDSEEILGTDFRQILTPESALLVGKRYAERQKGKNVPQHYTFDIIRKNKEIRKVEIHSTIIKTADGKPQTLAQLLDVTERDKTAKIIAKEHQRARQYFEVAATIMVVLDTNGFVMDINEKGCEVLETNEENILGKNWFSDFLPKNKSSEIQEQFKKSIEKEEITNPYLENRIKTAKGKEKLISWNTSLLKDENGKIVGTISSGEDISNKEEASRILKMSGILAILWKNNENWPIEFISDNVKEFTGYEHNDFYSGKVNYEQLMHPDDVSRINAEVEEFKKDNRSNYTHQPYRIITNDGDIKWVDDKTTVQYNSEGKITHFYGILSDITEEMQRGEKLRQSNEILAQMHDAVISTNLEGEINFWTGEAEQIFGYSNAEVLGEQVQELWEKDEKDTIFKEIIRDIDVYGHYQREIVGLRKNLSSVPIELTAKILYDTTKKPLSLIFVARNIKNRKDAQKALEESEIRYRHIFESILDGVIIYNMNQNIVQVNKMATQMYGYSYTEFTQTISSRYIHPVQNHSFEEVIEHLGNDYDKMFEGESVDISKTNKKFFVNVKGRLIKYNNEPHLLIIVRDITNIKQAEYELVKAKEKAVESEHLKSAFLANMSHEIRTPMNSIIGFSDLLGDEDISKDEKDHFIRIIRQNGNQLMNIINDIIDISKIEAGQIKLNYEKVNLCETFQDIYSMFELPSREKGLKLIKKSNHSEDEFFALTDDLRLKQILINLISNALKFTHKGYIEFGCNVIDNNKSIHFYVKDTGIGISKDKQEEIFQRFMQAELRTTKLYGGTGLGLAISQGLVKTFKGKIWLESTEGMGSTFNFTIPLITE